MKHLTTTLLLLTTIAILGCGDILGPTQEEEPTYKILLNDDEFPPTSTFDDGLLLMPCDTCEADTTTLN